VRRKRIDLLVAEAGKPRIGLCFGMRAVAAAHKLQGPRGVARPLPGEACSARACSLQRWTVAIGALQTISQCAPHVASRGFGAARGCLRRIVFGEVVHLVLAQFGG